MPRQDQTEKSSIGLPLSSRAVAPASAVWAEARVEGFDPAAIPDEVESALSPRERITAALTDVIVYPAGGRFRRHKMSQVGEGTHVAPVNLIAERLAVRTVRGRSRAAREDVDSSRLHLEV